VKIKKILFLVFVSALFFSGCAGGGIRLYEADISGFGRDESGRIIPEEGLVCIAIYGKEGKSILGETLVHSDYKKEISVAELSRDVCRVSEIPIVFSGAGPMTYVHGIDNLFEFDDGPESGWIYAVNGEYQNVGCASYTIKDRDYVEWHYTLDLGRDLGAYKLDE